MQGVIPEEGGALNKISCVSIERSGRAHPGDAQKAVNNATPVVLESMRGAATASLPLTYPQREEARPSFADRIWSQGVFRLHALLGRRIHDPAPFAAAVAARAALVPAVPLPELVPDLRDRMRRAPLSDDLLAECFGFFCVARGDALPDHVLGAARALMRGGIVELADREDRRAAIALAAAAMALHGTPVHLLAASAARANALVKAIEAPFAALGFRVAPVAPVGALGERQDACSRLVRCGTLRDIGLDYLRDRIALDRAPSGAARGPKLALLGMQCALVEDADEVMLDDAPTPQMGATPADGAGERLLFAQITAPRVLGRYLHLAGTCRDARGIESGFWRLYRLKTVRAGA